MNMKLNYMKNNFTTFEQSKRLIELGIPVDIIRKGILAVDYVDGRFIKYKTRLLSA